MTGFGHSMTSQQEVLEAVADPPLHGETLGVVPQRYAPSDHLEGVLGTGARSAKARPVPVWAWLISAFRMGFG